MTSMLTTPSVRSPGALRWTMTEPALVVSGSYEMPTGPKAAAFAVTFEFPDTRADAKHSWLNTVYSLVARGKSEHAAEALFEHFDDLIDEEKFEICDGLLLAVDLSRLKDTNVLVALLAVTLPATDSLHNRPGIVSRVEKQLKALAGDRTERLMRGLR